MEGTNCSGNISSDYRTLTLIALSKQIHNLSGVDFRAGLAQTRSLKSPARLIPSHGALESWMKQVDQVFMEKGWAALCRQSLLRACQTRDSPRFREAWLLLSSKGQLCKAVQSLSSASYSNRIGITRECKYQLVYFNLPFWFQDMLSKGNQIGSHFGAEGKRRAKIRKKYKLYLRCA